MTSVMNSENQGKVTYNEPEDECIADVYPLYSKSMWIFLYQLLHYKTVPFII